MSAVKDTFTSEHRCTSTAEVAGIALLCRALDQQRLSGLPALLLEFWVENLMQKCKSTVKYRSTHDPEVLLVNTLNQQHGLAVARRDFGYNWFHELIPIETQSSM